MKIEKINKVILGLECCKEHAWSCDQCPYGNMNTPLDKCRTQLLNDASELVNRFRRFVQSMKDRVDKEYGIANEEVERFPERKIPNPDDAY